MSIHVGIIPDGNRRFASRVGDISVTSFGHTRGLETLKRAFAWFLADDRVSTLTVYVLSEENLVQRAPGEIAEIFELTRGFLGEVRDFASVSPGTPGAVWIHMTSPELVPDDIREQIVRINRAASAVLKPEKVLNICFGYSGRREVLNAVNALVSATVTGERTGAVGMDEFTRALSVPDFPDLVVRTSGEKRVSGFLPWQCSYSELFFLDKLWPDVDPNLDLSGCVDEFFTTRIRRLGK